MNRTNIQWSDFSSNPIRYKNADGLDVWACSKVSAGCQNCYAETLALSSRMVSKGRALGAKFNDAEIAKLTPYVDEDELAAILAKKSAAGKRVFLGDMTDIFGEWVTDEMLDRVFAAMALRPDVTFQVLTKRPERMREYLTKGPTRRYWNSLLGEERELEEMSRLDAVSIAGGRIAASNGTAERAAMRIEEALAGRDLPWPLPNVWLGTSVENQEMADSRLPVLAEVPAAVRFVSGEPMLGPIAVEPELLAKFGWWIAGGESGTGARACDVEWIRDIVRQCRAAGVAPFVKQLGSAPMWPFSSPDCHWGGIDSALEEGAPLGWKHHDKDGNTFRRNERNERLGFYLGLKDRHGGDPAEWPEDLRVRTWPQ